MPLSLITAVPLLGPVNLHASVLVAQLGPCAPRACQVVQPAPAPQLPFRPWSEVAGGFAAVQAPANVAAAHFVRGTARLGATAPVLSVRGARVSVGGALGKRYELDGLNPLDPWGAGSTSIDGVISAQAPLGPVEWGITARVPLLGVDARPNDPWMPTAPVGGMFLGTKLGGALPGRARWVAAMEADHGSSDRPVHWASSFGLRLDR